MRTHQDEIWEWIEKKGSKGVTFAGNYFFFSSNRSMLKALAQQEIALHIFTCAAVLFIRIKGEVNICCAYMIQITGEKESWLCDKQITKALNISAG